MVVYAALAEASRDYFAKALVFVSPLRFESQRATLMKAVVRIFVSVSVTMRVVYEHPTEDEQTCVVLLCHPFTSSDSGPPSQTANGIENRQHTSRLPTTRSSYAEVDERCSPSDGTPRNIHARCTCACTCVWCCQNYMSSTLAELRSTYSCCAPPWT